MKRMIIVLVACLVTVAPGIARGNSAPVVSNVWAGQRSGEPIVDIYYYVTDADADLLTITVLLSEDGGSTYTIPCVSATGDIGAGVSPNGGRQIAWNAEYDYPDHQGDSYFVKVLADDGASLPVPMVLVPAGTFTMGDGAANCGADERVVTLTNDYYLGQHEVTNSEYRDALQWAYDQGHVTATSSTVQDNLDGSTVQLVDLNSQYGEITFSGGIFSLRESPSSYAQSAYPGGYDPADHPVKEVSWYGAVAYCDWLSLQAGYTRAYDHSDWSCNGGDPYGASGYRLPTDAEWEFAAQYNDERIYPWGSETPDCSRANNYQGGYCVGWTSPVGNYPAAPVVLGLYDMAGNVWEWCNDWHTCGLGTSPETDPTGPGTGSSRVLRGGGWNNGASRLRCAARYYGNPSNAGSYGGFRCARSH